MRRTRLATLSLAGTLLVSSSGCFNLFERFQSWRYGGAGMDCTCNDVSAQHGMMVPTSAEGPVLVAPEPTFVGPPPTAVPQGPPPGAFPQGPPPRIVPIPQGAAQTTPWTGQH